MRDSVPLETRRTVPEIIGGTALHHQIIALQIITNHNPLLICKHYRREVMAMDRADFWRLFCETGEPMAYLLYAAAAETKPAEEALRPSA